MPSWSVRTTETVSASVSWSDSVAPVASARPITARTAVAPAACTCTSVQDTGTSGPDASRAAVHARTAASNSAGCRTNAPGSASSTSAHTRAPSCQTRRGPGNAGP